MNGVELRFHKVVIGIYCKETCYATNPVMLHAKRSCAYSKGPFNKDNKGFAWFCNSFSMLAYPCPVAKNIGNDSHP